MIPRIRIMIAPTATARANSVRGIFNLDALDGRCPVDTAEGINEYAVSIVKAKMITSGK